MKRNNKWRWFLVIFVFAWALRELYPPTNQDLVKHFKDRAVSTDTNFTAILTKAEALTKERPERAFANLLEAIGTNDITPYFPMIQLDPEMEPNRAVLHRLQRETAGKIKLGLDLRGGTSFLVMMDTNRFSQNTDQENALNHAVEVLRHRVDRLGVAEPMLQPSGLNRILIALPGLSEAEYETARRTIEKAAFLEFRMVHENSDQFIQQGLPAPGYEVLRTKAKKGSSEQSVAYLVRKTAERGLTGVNVKYAVPARHPVSGDPEIHFTMDDEGARKFREITTEYAPQGNKYYQLAIVLDGELRSAPRIMGVIPSGSGTISGSFTLKEAWELANTLENPLEAPVKIVEERRVDPSLGKDSIRSGITASIIGTVAVSLFMLVYYMFSGFVANVALVVNVFILIGVMCSVGTTLTVPGIAGIVLTIGMAVDANVLIFERIREELAAGKSLRGALEAGYDKAFSTIFDSNLTTLIASVILIYMGTGPVKGFGVTLTIGVSVSMFTALVLTRLIFDWLMDRGMIKGLSMLHLVRGNNINFMKYAKMAFAVSWTIILIGCTWGLIRGKSVMGVDFVGGDDLTLTFAQKVDVDKLRKTAETAGANESLIQYQSDMLTGSETLRMTVPIDKGLDVQKALKTQFPEAKFEQKSLDKVGAAVGNEILRAALLSILIAMFGILIYVAMRYEFSFAVGAVIALVHDILMTSGIFCISGRQFSGPMVAAILTIIGFSINDTIVIFDRIREDLKLGIKGTFVEIMNKALNQTLSRTIITSGTVFLATASLYLFGGGVINDFAFTFLVGIITGTYSSIYIAGSIVLWWNKGARPNIGTQLDVQATEVVPSATKA